MVDDRLSIAEKDLRDHAKSISTIVNEVGRFDSRITVLEKAEMDRLLSETDHNARREERGLALELRLKGIESKLDKLLSFWSKISTAIILAFVGLAVAWVVRGGMVPPTN